MNDNAIKELEAAAQIILAPPSCVTSEQRHASELLFMKLRKLKNPYEMCRQILEKSNVDFVLFQTADVLKNAIISEWAYLPPEDKGALRQYLLNYITHKELPSFVREKLMQVIAIMIKRASLEDFGSERGLILEEVQKMISSGDVNQQILSSMIISAILQEYVITVKSDDTGLTFEDHFKAKKIFELQDLRKIFVMILQAIEEIMKLFDKSNNLHVILMRHYLFIIETIMTWGFVSPRLPKKLIGAFESIYKIEQGACLRLNRQWESIILEPKVLEIFFNLYWKIRDNPEIQLKGLTCIVQLSTLCGPILNNAEVKLKYALNFLGHFLHLLNNIEIREQEALGISTVFRKFLFYNPPKELKDLPSDVLNSLMQKMFVVTSQFSELSSREEQINPEDTIYMESFSNILEAWITVVQGKEYFSKELFETTVSQMFDKYLQCHLSPPQGLRGIVCNDNGELNGDEVKDRVRFKEQLIIIGMFGREVPGHSLPILSKLLEDKTRNLYGQLQTLVTMNQNMKISDSKILEALYEDIHWTLLISSYVLANDSDGEQSLIPPEIMSYSIQQTMTGACDITTSLTLLASPAKDIAEFPNAENTSDQVIRLVSAVFRLCELEKSAIDAKMGHFLSPEISSTLMWFLKLWSEAYLLPSTEYYSKISDPIQQAFGQDTPGGVWSMNYILDKIGKNVQSFTSEITVIDDSIELFISLVKKNSKCSVVFGSDYFKAIIELKNINLPIKAKKGLIKGLVAVAVGISDKSIQKQYLEEILKPISDRYKTVMSQPNMNHIYQNENVKIQVVNLIEEINACFSGISQSSANLLFGLFKDIFIQLPQLLELYHNYIMIIELILQLLCEAAQNMLFFDEQHVLTAVCLEVIRVYVRYNANRISSDSSAEEDSLQDLLLLLQLMNHLLAKNFFEENVPGNAIDSAEVVIYGLTHLMPLVTMDLLKYPNLCIQFYKTVTFFVDAKSHKIHTLHPDLLKQMFYSVELGLTSFGSDVQTLCFDFLQVMGNTVQSDQNPSSFMYTSLVNFVKILLDMILTQQVNSENKLPCGRALFALLCVYKEQYYQIVQHILQSQRDPSDSERLTKEFTDLTKDLTLSNTRPFQNEFVDRFDKFLINVGFLN